VRLITSFKKRGLEQCLAQMQELSSWKETVQALGTSGITRRRLRSFEDNGNSPPTFTSVMIDD
jgi:hypothetical protein